ncbi:hypothetical protein TdN_18960 [Thermodesulfovibrio sp. TK110]
MQMKMDKLLNAHIMNVKILPSIKSISEAQDRAMNVLEKGGDMSPPFRIFN